MTTGAIAPYREALLQIKVMPTAVMTAALYCAHRLRTDAARARLGRFGKELPDEPDTQ